MKIQLICIFRKIRNDVITVHDFLLRSVAILL